MLASISTTVLPENQTDWGIVAHFVSFSFFSFFLFATHILTNFECFQRGLSAIRLTLVFFMSLQIILNQLNQSCSRSHHVSIHETYSEKILQDGMFIMITKQKESLWTGCEELYDQNPISSTNYPSSFFVGIHFECVDKQALGYDGEIAFRVSYRKLLHDLAIGPKVHKLTPTMGNSILM